MFNAASIEAVREARLSENSVKPLYQSYCFANIPASIRYLLTGEGRCALPQDVFGGLPDHYDRVILFFVDAFGWRFFERYAHKYTLLKAFAQDGCISKITSQFPSTTAAHVTCIHTGLNVGQSGVYEWNYYEPLVDEVITPLMFSFVGDKTRDTLKRAAIPAEAYFPRSTFYQQLQSSGIASYVFQSADFTPSTPSSVYYKGATVFPFKNPDEGLTALARLLDSVEKGYCFFYYNAIDTACHLKGPNSKEFEQAVDTFFTTFEKHLSTLFKSNHGRTLFLMTADHGQIEVNPAKTYYLNRQIVGIEDYLRRNRRGKPLVPAGSARDMFLYVKQDRHDETIALLQRNLEGIARVHRVQEFIEQGFFGTLQPSHEFLGRAGNVLILPEPFETVWWYEYGKIGMSFAGHHGGLTPAEMEIPLFALSC